MANTATGTSFAQSSYKFDYTVFPSDIGMENQGHYIVININVPTKGFKTNGLAVNDVAGSFDKYVTPLDQVSKLDVLRFGSYEIPGAIGAPKTTPSATLPLGFTNINIPSSIPRNTRRIAESIALFTPTPLVFNSHNVYEEVSLSALGGKAIGISAQFFGGFMGGLTKQALQAFATSGLVTATSKLAQSPINPMVEIVFANTLQRQFAMEWLLAPRNEEESLAIQKIVQTLRFHAAPEINPNIGFMWIPPAEFDITFFHNGNENTKMLRVNTCVLERCEVQYDPTGVYSTFRNGHPVAVRLSLAFRELEPVHKARVLEGF